MQDITIKIPYEDAKSLHEQLLSTFPKSNRQDHIELLMFIVALGQQLQEASDE